jgi:nucleoside 2-deoxyribosyltransferase
MIYLASPYTHSDVHVREWRFREACRAAAALLRAGITVFSPIAHSHPIAAFGMPTSWDFWSQVDREYLSRCDVLAVLTLPGWRESVGVQAEIGLAGQLGLPVVFVAPSDLDLEDRDPPHLDELRQLRQPTEQRAA